MGKISKKTANSVPFCCKASNMTSSFRAPTMARVWIPLTSGHKGSLRIQEPYQFQKPLPVTSKIPAQNNNGTVKQGSQDTVNITSLDQQERRQNIFLPKFSKCPILQKNSQQKYEREKKLTMKEKLR